jgi:hypothetical protein
MRRAAEPAKKAAAEAAGEPALAVTTTTGAESAQVIIHGVIPTRSIVFLPMAVTAI